MGQANPTVLLADTQGVMRVSAPRATFCRSRIHLTHSHGGIREGLGCLLKAGPLSDRGRSLRRRGRAGTGEALAAGEGVPVADWEGLPPCASRWAKGSHLPSGLLQEKFDFLSQF